jgi:hypothetical protein
MTKRMETKGEIEGRIRCANCGHQRKNHYSVNYSDGPWVAGETLVCPNGIFTPRERKALRPRKR